MLLLDPGSGMDKNQDPGSATLSVCVSADGNLEGWGRVINVKMGFFCVCVTMEQDFSVFSQQAT